MLHWLDSLLPRLPHYGYALVFIVVFLNNVGFPLPGETILLGAGLVFGRYDENTLATLSSFQSRGIGSLYCRLHPARVLFWEEYGNFSKLGWALRCYT
jgi:membrane protein DedA with SNARE-associated domain